MNTPQKDLGSSRDGTHHWIVMRLSSLALLPLCLWFVLDAFPLLLTPLEEARSWFESPWRAALLISFFACSFHHGVLGLQCVCEDYIPSTLQRFIVIAALRYLSLILTIAIALAIATLHFEYLL